MRRTARPRPAARARRRLRPAGARTGKPRAPPPPTRGRRGAGRGDRRHVRRTRRARGGLHAVPPEPRPDLPGQGRLVRGARVPRVVLPDLPPRARRPARGRRRDRRGAGAGHRDPLRDARDRAPGRASRPSPRSRSRTPRASPRAPPWSSDAAHYAVVNARMSGIVRAIRADVGDRVRAGAPLATLESAEVGEERSRLKAAQARAPGRRRRTTAASRNCTRGASWRCRRWNSPRRRCDTARADVDAAESAAAHDRRGEGGVAGTCVLTAPIAGVVTRRAATVGTLVDPEETLFEIVDTSALWAEIDVPEADAPRVRARPARRARTSRACPARELPGHDRVGRAGGRRAHAHGPRPRAGSARTTARCAPTVRPRDDR